MSAITVLCAKRCGGEEPPSSSPHLCPWTKEPLSDLMESNEDNKIQNRIFKNYEVLLTLQYISKLHLKLHNKDFLRERVLAVTLVVDEKIRARQSA